MEYQQIRVERREAVGLIILDRPDALNALSVQMIRELGHALTGFERDDAVGAVVITGSDKAFAAGADVRDLAERSYMDMYLADFPAAPGDAWAELGRMRKPVIAAVAGYCLGGGCELAMACDFILAADTARFGQPEVRLGTMPGAGGTQRLARLVGRSKAMELCLTGRMMDAAEAERSGLVSRVLAPDELLDETLGTAARIAALSRPAVYAIKESVHAASETSLAEGLRLERRAFHGTFAGEDRLEGMNAFLEKREPRFRNR